MMEHFMRPRLVILVCFFGILLSASPALARSPRSKRHAQETPAGPPFPWTAIVETVGPVLGMWLSAVLLRRTLAREKATPELVSGEIVSLPVAWFAATSGLFEKTRTETNAAPPEKKPLDESENRASTIVPPDAELQELTTFPPRPDSDS
jgi:hypothetical protein